jgi:ankyrin repeat protein
MPPPSLQSIPPEITIQITEYLGIKDLDSLVRVSHQFHSLLSSQLYTLGALWSPDQKGGNDTLPPLAWCLRNSHRNAATELLLKRANPALLGGGTTAIHEAVQRDYVDELRLMLDRPCCIKNLRNGLDETPLMTAARLGQEACARALLDSEQGGNLIDALQVAVSQSQEAIVRLILGCIAAPFNFKDDELTVLLSSAVKKSHAGILRRLLTFAATTFVEFDINKATDELVRHARDKACIDVLFRFGADINYRASWGWTFLHETILSRNCEAAAHLLDRGADIDAVDTGGTTPLMFAAYIADGEEIAQLLIDRGANIETTDRDGLNAMHNAASRGKTHMVELLHRAGLSVRALSGDEGWTALHYASLAGSEDSVRYLVDAGADISAVDSNGQTALHVAIMADSTDVAQVLILAGAPLDVTDLHFKTPLHYAVEGKNMYLIQLLLEALEKVGSDLSRRDPFIKWLPMQHPDGTTSYWNAGSVLHDAVANGQEKIAEPLLSKQRNIHSRDIYGRTVLDWTPGHKPSLREKILSYCGDHPQTTDPKQQTATLRQSTTTLVTNLLLFPDMLTQNKPQYQHHLYTLGKCLLYLNDESAARTAFALQAQCDPPKPQTRENAKYANIVCTRCRVCPSVDHGRWVCTVCPQIDLCDVCAETYRNFLVVGEACVSHRMVEVRGQDWDALKRVDGRGLVCREWLEGLIELYGD